MSNITRLVILAVALTIGIVGCSKLPGTSGPGPAIAEIPMQEAATGVELQVPLSDFVSNPGDQTLSWEVLNGPGQIDNGRYAGTFNDIGTTDVTFRVTNGDGRFADADFTVAALYGFMGIIKNGHGIELLDAGEGTLETVQIGGNMPLEFREMLPNGSLVYERMSGSGVDLFVYDYDQIRQVGQGTGLNTVYDSHTPDGKIFFEEGNPGETGLYMWDPETDNTSLVAFRNGMHTRNAFFAPPNIVYFEYGNNGQADLNYWEIGAGNSVSAFSSDYPEEIKAVLPDGGVVFSTTGVSGQPELRYFRVNHGVYTVGGDLPPSVQGQQATFLTTSSQGLVYFETGTTSRDVWAWTASGLTSTSVGSSSADERFLAITEDDLVIYSVETSPGNRDIKLFNYAAGSSTDVAVSSEDEVFEAALSDSDIIFAIETATGRSLHRFDVASSSAEIIDDSAAESCTVDAVLSNDRVVYTRTGLAGGLLTWNPTTRVSQIVGGPGTTYAGEGPDGGFLMNVVAFNQTDLAFWNGVSGQVISIAQTPQSEHFEGAFSNGVIIYSMAVPPKTTTDLFEWRAGQTTRMTDGAASHSIVRILRGDF